MPDTPSIEADARHEPASRIIFKVTPSLSDYPRSHAANYIRPAQITPEEEALRDLKNEWKTVANDASPSESSHPRQKVLIADLHDFEIYRCLDGDRLRPSELSCLHFFDINAKNLCFDGHVRYGSATHYIERVGIHDISIEGYGRRDSPKVFVYLQTRLASEDKTHDSWFRLRNTALNYKRFHDPFLWIATFAKFAIDYMDDQPTASVRLESFRNEFHAWLVRRFGYNRRFKAWFAAFRNVSDFRIALHAYVDFIHNQAVNLSTSDHLMSHPVWSHCKCGRRLAVKKQPNVEGNTLVTPHVFRSFKHMYFGDKLKNSVPSNAVAEMQEKRKQVLGFASDGASQLMFQQSTHIDRNMGISNVQVDNVVSIAPDRVDNTKWKTSDTEWLAYVQGVQRFANGTQRLFVLWLYRPADTTICKEFYHFSKEVFLSDNCNCEEREIFTTDITRVHTVAWNPRSLETAQDLIIRQTYMTNENSFVTAKNSHKVCSCRTPKPTRTGWSTGDTVYIMRTVNRQELLEPVVIHSINHEEKEATVQTLLRLARDLPKLALKAGRTNIAPNGVVLTNKFTTLPVSQIKRACRIRFVPQDDVIANPQRIPAPYNKGGVGDHWVITMGLQVNNNIDSLVPLHMLPQQMRQDQDASPPLKKLRGLSLFGGGGNLDRGLEEGGAVEFLTSVDYDSAAIHTQLANCKNPTCMQLFCGYISDYLQSLISGDKNRLVARIGEVELIAAGPPCPGTH